MWLRGSIVKVVSHIQALKQTKINIAKLLPGVISEEIEDTAIGAKRLSEGLLGYNVAVICSKKAGKKYSLELIKENIEDREDNTTSFKMYERKCKQ